MRELIDIISEEVKNAFEAAGYDRELGGVSLSNRPDLCEFQCNGAMAGAKVYKCAPIQIANAVAENLAGSDIFSQVEAVMPGFLNFKVSEEMLAKYVSDMKADEGRFGLDKVSDTTVMIDYGGPNVAKPLHVGHLRSAVIGESVKRIFSYMGHNAIGDVHLGDWGLQMGLIITELQERKPDLCYFDEAFEGEYPTEAPFTISELEEIYPTASGKSKEDDDFKARALSATKDLQNGRRGYRALWQHILNISIADLKKNYENLNVSFELWKGESDADAFIPDMVEAMKKSGLAHESEGALVVDVVRESDTKEIPPCIILKSDGSALYATTDLATLVWRMDDYNPSQVIYVVDKRQEMHFTQVFRTSRMAGICPEDMKLDFLGFGTMNGLDGKPFKTRDGGVMRLEMLLSDINDKMLEKIRSNDTMSEEEAVEVAKIVSLAAVKYGDLSNQASKDYIFDIDKFTSSEGNTGPYILYTIVRIKSILNKYKEQGGVADGSILAAQSDSEKALCLELVKFQAAIKSAYFDIAPHKICAYIYDLSNAFNHFYHDTKILVCPDEDRKKSYIALLELTRDVLEQCINLLGFYSPERM